MFRHRASMDSCFPLALKPVWMHLRYVSMRACVLFGSISRQDLPLRGTPPPFTMIPDDIGFFQTHFFREPAMCAQDSHGFRHSHGFRYVHLSSTQPPCRRLSDSLSCPRRVCDSRLLKPHLCRLSLESTQIRKLQNLRQKTFNIIVVLVGLLNRVNAKLSLLQPLKCHRTRSAIGSATFGSPLRDCVVL